MREVQRQQQWFKRSNEGREENQMKLKTNSVVLFSRNFCFGKFTFVLKLITRGNPSLPHLSNFTPPSPISCHILSIFNLSLRKKNASPCPSLAPPYLTFVPLKIVSRSKETTHSNTLEEGIQYVTQLYVLPADFISEQNCSKSFGCFYCQYKISEKLQTSGRRLYCLLKVSG